MLRGGNLGFKGEFPVEWPGRLGLLVTMVPRGYAGAIGDVLLMFCGILYVLGPRGGGGGE